MNTVSPDPMTAEELTQLMHFYAESGVDYLLEDEPLDRFAEFAAMEAARARPAVRNDGVPAAADAQTLSRPASQRAAAPPPQRTAVAVPDVEAAAEARNVAAAAQSLEALQTAIAAFAGCNLRNSARNTVFMSGEAGARIAIAAGVPTSDDDRDGNPFAGAAGAMLDKMLAGIGLARQDVVLFNLIPWRPPGNRPPTPHEMEICRPFGSRLIELLAPRAVLALGNMPARFLTGSNDGIHSQRGRWIDYSAGAVQTPMMATFHPSDLIAAPALKKLAWQDLLTFRTVLTN